MFSLCTDLHVDRVFLLGVGLGKEGFSISRYCLIVFPLAVFLTKNLLFFFCCSSTQKMSFLPSCCLSYFLLIVIFNNLIMLYQVILFHISWTWCSPAWNFCFLILIKLGKTSNFVSFSDPSPFGISVYMYKLGTWSCSIAHWCYFQCLFFSWYFSLCIISSLLEEDLRNKQFLIVI